MVELTNVVRAVCGGLMCAALKSDGSAVTWGPRTSYYVNNGIISDSILTDVADVTCGDNTCVAMRTNGTVVAWGGNWDISGVNLTNVIYAQCGSSVCVALKSDSTAVAWGDADYGGDASSVDMTNIASAPMGTTPTQPAASATGDPHLENIHGERFDLMKEGKHVLINVPFGASAATALLHVQADARRVGFSCQDMYFKEVNVSGSWAEARQVGGYHYSASRSDSQPSGWVQFGKVSLKVVVGVTHNNVHYLNVYAKHLNQAGFPIGGLLGEDDHIDVSAPPKTCVKRLSLKKQVGNHIFESASVAIATLTQ